MKAYGLAVKSIITNEAGEMLLLRRSAANSSFVGCWELPGGKVDPGEDFATAVLRETKEETGLDVEITGLAGATEFEMPKVHVVLLCMHAQIVGGGIKLSHEHDEHAWTAPDRVSALTLATATRPFMEKLATSLSGTSNR